MKNKKIKNLGTIIIHGDKFILDSKRNIIKSKKNFALSESQVVFLLHFKRSLLIDSKLTFSP